MRLKTVLFSAAMVTMSGAAWAQTPPPAGDTPPPPPPPMTQAGEAPPPHMPGGHMPHGEPKAPQAGFHIQTGDETGLKVECGDLAIAECIQAAQPLIDLTN